MHLLLGKIQLAGADIFVRVKLNLLEPNHARNDVNLTVRAVGVARELVDRRDPRVGNRIGVIVAVDRTHVRFTPFEVQPFNLILPGLDDVDRLGMQCRLDRW